MLVKNAAAELLRTSQLSYLDLYKLSNSRAYLDMAAFCLLDLSLLAAFET
jgi:hypothetical protein